MRIANTKTLLMSEILFQILKICRFRHNANGGCRYQFFSVTSVTQPLTDKNTLSAIRNSIQRGFESWFRLSVEELLPTDTHCSNCDSSEFRKEATLIDGHFANLLQIIDNSDFKKALGGATSVMFVPQPSSSDAEWIKWLAEISVISAALTRSRPIKESQPFKQLKLSVMPKIGRRN